MSNPFLGEIKLVPYNFAPRGWAFCQGQILSIQQNTALFSLLGTTYGGNGITTFGLPNLQGTVIIHPGQGALLSNYVNGQVGGSESVTLQNSQIPTHTHTLVGSSAVGDVANPSGAYLASADATVAKIYGSTISGLLMPFNTVSTAGQNQPHENRMPYLALNYIIALQGIFPARS
jgi:microcystin-dependent protein